MQWLHPRQEHSWYCTPTARKINYAAAVATARHCATDCHKYGIVLVGMGEFPVPSRRCSTSAPCLACAPPCLVRMWSDSENWVRRDDRHVLQDISTDNIVVLHHDSVATLQSVLTAIKKASPTTKTVPVQRKSYHMPVLVAQAGDAHCEQGQGQQRRVASKGARLFATLVKAKSTEV